MTTRSRQAAEPIPDLLAELRSGRYPHDFVRRLVALDQVGGTERLRLLHRLLDHDDGGDVLAGAVLAGTLHILEALNKFPAFTDGDAAPSQAETAAAKLADISRGNDRLALEIAANVPSLAWT